jgi:lysophospholipase L1-like esterase
VKFADSANIEYIKFESGIKGNAVTFPTATIKQIFGMENVPFTTVMPSFNGATKLVKAPAYPTTITQTENLAGIFTNCYSLVDASDFVIPSSIVKTGPWFAQCDNLEYGCTIPATVKDGTTQFYWKTPKLRHTRVESKSCPVSANFVTGSDNSGLVNDCEIELYTDSVFFSGLRELAYATQGSIDRKVYCTPISGKINNISVFGDSLTSGQIADNYPKALTAKLSSDAIVWNMGVSGSTMEQQLQRMRDYPKKMQADVIVQWGGSNGSFATQGVDNYLACLEEMVALFGTDKYIIITPTDHTYSAERDTAVANAYGNHYLNLREYFESKGYSRSEYQTDNLHFTAEGYEIVAQAIYEKGKALGYWT